MNPLHPLKQLQGRLNHIRMPYQHVMKIMQLTNTIEHTQPKNNILESYSIEKLKSLVSNQNKLNKKTYQSLDFELYVNQNPRYPVKMGDLNRQLPKSQRNIVNTIKQFISNLNSRQTSYLNYRVRQRLGTQFPNWQNLHINQQCPYLRDICLIPRLQNIAEMLEVKTVEKKRVFKIMGEVRKELSGGEKIKQETAVKGKK